MQQQIARVASDIVDGATQQGYEKRFIVGVAGIPGSGKSTVAFPLVKAINERLSSDRRTGHWKAVVVSLDGWHYSLAQLASMPNPEYLLSRRGAHFTFDGEAYADFIRTLDSSSESISFPTFSHSGKDPVIAGGTIEPHHRIIIIEGLYALLDREPWSYGASRCNRRIWVEADRKVAERRLVKRHLAEGVESILEAAEMRARVSDLPNGDFIQAHSMVPHVIIPNDDGTDVSSSGQRSNTTTHFPRTALFTQHLSTHHSAPSPAAKLPTHA